MQMTDRLSAIRARIDHQAVTTLVQSLLHSDCLRYSKKPAKEVRFGTRLVERGEVALGNDEDVRRSLRADISEGDDPIGVV